jgi:hypothetical protein
MTLVLLPPQMFTVHYLHLIADTELKSTKVGQPLMACVHASVHENLAIGPTVSIKAGIYTCSRM